MTIEREQKWAMGSMPAFALHGTLLLVGAIVFAVVAVIHFGRSGARNARR
jgi:hypothetical protein